MLRVQITHRAPHLRVDFSVPAGVTALFGPSGAGKTSVLMAVAGLLRADQAEITLDGQALPQAPHRRRIGMVFQEPRLFPHLSLRQNLTYGQRWARPGGPDLDQVTALLGLDGLLSRPIAALSGGEAQRVSIGRALLSNPAVLLMDEPLSALDATRKAEILPWLESLAETTRLPVLYVSHSMTEIARLARRMVVIDQGQQRAEGALEEILSDPGLVGLIGLSEAGSVIPAMAGPRAADGLTEVTTRGGLLYLPLNVAPGTRLRLRLPAQDILLSRARPQGLSALNILQARILQVTEAEGQALIQLAMGEDRFLARLTLRSTRALGLAPGQEIHAVLKTVALAGAA